MTSERVAVFGTEALRASVTALGFEPVTDAARVAVVDVGDPEAVARAASCRLDVPRVFVCRGPQIELLAALGLPSDRIAADADPAVLGPVLTGALPRDSRSATRAVAVTGVRGGVGRTLLATNLARRIASRLRVCVVDATGSGAAAWWLRCEARPWAELEALSDELTTDQLAVVATEIAPNLRLVGGRGTAPTPAIVEAAVRAATHLDDLVIVDLPSAFETCARWVREHADRSLVLAYDEPLSLDALDALPLDDAWLIASQSVATRIGSHDVFRSLARDESAVRAALASRSTMRGSLGRSYDDLAELLVIDAS